MMRRSKITVRMLAALAAILIGPSAFAVGYVVGFDRTRAALVDDDKTGDGHGVGKPKKPDALHGWHPPGPMFAPGGCETTTFSGQPRKEDDEPGP